MASRDDAAGRPKVPAGGLVIPWATIPDRPSRPTGGPRKRRPSVRHGNYHRPALIEPRGPSHNGALAALFLCRRVLRRFARTAPSYSH